MNKYKKNLSVIDLQMLDSQTNNGGGVILLW